MKSMDVTLTIFAINLILALTLPWGTTAALNRPVMVEIRSAKVDGPPIRPSEFTSVAELNQYLAKVAKYYKMMGRPRFGKRSYSSDEDMYYSDSNMIGDKYSEPSSKYNKLWELLKQASSRLSR